MNSCIYRRLELSTPTELNRLCRHLRLKPGASVDLIKKTYFEAAEHTISTATRPFLSNKLPTYSYVLKCVYKEMRSIGEALDETWQQVSAFKSEGYQSPIEKMSDSELEDQIGKMHNVAATDAREKLDVGKGWRSILYKLIKWLYKLILKLGDKAAFTFLVTRLPLAGAGPTGLALGVLLVGKQMLGPSYKKLIPTTIELISIAKRIDNMPNEEEA
jgi:hypothetical protein